MENKLDFNLHTADFQRKTFQQARKQPYKSATVFCPKKYFDSKIFIKRYYYAIILPCFLLEYKNQRAFPRMYWSQ